MNSNQAHNGTIAAALQGHANLLPQAAVGATANHYRVKLGSRLVVVTAIDQQPGVIPDDGPTAAPVTAAIKPIFNQDMINREVRNIDKRITSSWRAYVAVCGLILLTCVSMAVAFAQYASGVAPAGGWATTVLIVTPLVLIALFFAMAKLTNQFSRIRRHAEELQAAERTLQGRVF